MKAFAQIALVMLENDYVKHRKFFLYDLHWQHYPVVNTKNEIFGRTHDYVFDKADGLFRHAAKCKEISTNNRQTSTHRNFDQRQGEIIWSCNWSAWRETRL